MAHPSISAAFGAVVRARRKALGLSQESLAERATVHPTYVSRIEGGNKNPSLGVAARLAEALELSLWMLIREAEESTEE